MPRSTLSCLICLLATAGAAAGELPVGAAALAPASEAGTAPLRWSAGGAVTDGGYRMALTRGAVDVGLQFEQRMAAARPQDARFDSPAPAGATLPALSVGLRSVSPGPAPASSLVERAMAAGTSEPYVSKVGIEWKPAQQKVFLNQGLGFRLGDDEKLTMRLRKGSLGIYLKRNF